MTMGNYKDTSIGFGANVGASIEKGLASATHIAVAQAEQPPVGDAATPGGAAQQPQPKTVIVNPADGSTVELTDEQKAALKARQEADAAAAAQAQPAPKPAAEVKKDEPAPKKSDDDEPWYDTTWGKIGIGAGLLALGVAAGYGIACWTDTSAD